MSTKKSKKQNDVSKVVKEVVKEVEPEVIKTDIKKKTKVVAFDLGEDDSESKKVAKSKDNKDAFESLLNMSQFNLPKKQSPVVPKEKDIVIDMDHDSQEEIIRKLVLTVQKLKTELNEYKNYVDGTYCTISVFNRSIDDFNNELNNRISGSD